METNKRKEGLLNRIVKGVKKFSRRKLVRNKVLCLVLLILGYASTNLFVGYGVCLLCILLAIVLFLARVDVIKFVLGEEV